MLLNSERLRRKTFPHWAPLAAMGRGVEGCVIFRIEDFVLRIPPRRFSLDLVLGGLRDVQDSEVTA